MAEPEESRLTDISSSTDIDITTAQILSTAEDIVTTSTVTSTTVTTSTQRDIIVDGMNHLLQGKRHLLVQDFPSAVISLQEACQIFVKKYGETADECGEVYFQYGKALLELAREEAEVVDKPAAGSDDEDEDEKDEDEEEEERETAESGTGNSETGKEHMAASEVGDGGDGATSNEMVYQENQTQENKDLKRGDEEEDEAAEEDLSDEKEEKVLSETLTESKDNVTSTGVLETEPGPSGLQEKTDEEKSEEISNLQLAWEVLELSKIIFERQSLKKKDMKLKTAEILLKLGEVSIESENYEQAVNDLSECLIIQTEHLQPDDRLIAETHYQLGLAYSFDNKFKAAIDSFNEAIEVIQNRISSLRKLIPEGPNSFSIMDDNPTALAAREVEELESVLPDIKSKIDDTLDSIRTTERMLKEAALQRRLEESMETLSSAGESSSKSPVKPVSNITHLVKRKRKPEEEGCGNSHEVKKLKEESPPVNSCINGVKKSEPDSSHPDVESNSSLPGHSAKDVRKDEDKSVAVS